MSPKLKVLRSLFLVGTSFFFFISQLPASISQQPSGYVNDFAGVIDLETKSNLNALLIEVEQKSSAEIALVTVPSLEGMDIETAAVELYKKWGIGKKGKDNGVLVLMSIEDRVVRIEVGYGLESILPDGKCGEIIRSDMIPYFKEGNYGLGLAAGTGKIAEIIAQDSGVPLTGIIQSKKPSAKYSLLQMILSGIVLVLLSFLFIQNPLLFLLLLSGSGGRGGGGGGFGGGFGGFGGGLSGGGGASGRW